MPFLNLHQSPPQRALIFEAFEKVEAAAYAECPLGVLVLNIARTMLCAGARAGGCYIKHSSWVSQELYRTPLSVVIGTEWPIYALLNSIDWVWPGIPHFRDYECVNTSILDWPVLRHVFAEEPKIPGRSWWLDSLRFVFDKRWAHSMYVASRECLYGIYVANFVKAMWAADTESSSYLVYAPYVQWVLYESVHLLGATQWPIFALLHHFTSLRRHGFRLDFTSRELGGLPFRDHGEWLQAQPLERHIELVDAVTTWGPHLAEVVPALRSALGHAPPELRFVYVTMVYGRFNRYIAGWARRVQRLGVKNLVMVTLDAAAYDLCREHHGKQCVTGNISVLNKYTVLLVALQLGIDVMWLDFDIFLVANPQDAVIAAAGVGKDGYDVLMGYDYLSDCLCNGFFYLRARPITHVWLFELLRWLYDHPYEHDQRAISAFLNYTERIAATSEELPPIPRWQVFEVDNTFINWGGWEGRFEELVLVHFVDGSAFSLYGRPDWDPSIPESKKRRHELSSGARLDQDRTSNQGGQGMDISPMDLFYSSSRAIDAAPEDLWEAEPLVRRVLESQIKPQPELRQRCGILPEVAGAHSGYGWLTEAANAAKRAKAAQKYVL